MKLFAHRGNTSGPFPELENKISYIKGALEIGYGVELDVIKGASDRFYLGHDQKQEEIDLAFLKDSRILTHAKDFYTFSRLLEHPDINTFFQDKEKLVISSKGNIIHHQYEPTEVARYTNKSIIVNLQKVCPLKYIYGNKSDLAYGIITDYCNSYLEAKNKTFKLLILDVDGVLTTGHKIYDMRTGCSTHKEFFDRDFTAIKKFISLGIPVVFLSGDENNKSIAEQRGIPFHSTKKSFTLDKSKELDILCAKYEIYPVEAAYVGDDYYDLSIIDRVGWSFCPSNAAKILKNRVSKVLNRECGKGVVEELFDEYEHITGQCYPWEPAGKMPSSW